MKKMISLIFLISVISLSAQELVEKDFPNVGNNGLYRSFSNFEVKDPADRVGADVVWDYSTFPSSQALQSVLWLPIENAKEDQRTAFSDATYFVEDNTSDLPISFYTAEESSHKYLGFNFNGQNYKFQNPVDYYAFPMSFEQSLNSEFVFEDEELSSGTISVTYDAYGSIKIPELEFEDVFRLKIETKTVFPDTPDDTIISREYHYFERGTGKLVLRLNEISPSPTEGRVICSYIYFVEPITSVSPELTINTILYPNPTQSELRLITPNHTVVNYEIYNQLGAVVGSGVYNDFVDVKRLSSGSYFIRAELENNQSVIKNFIKD